MIVKTLIISSLSFILLNVSTFASGSSADSTKVHTGLNYKVDNISKKIGFELTENHTEHLPLYSEAIKWLGVRYRRSGMTTKGVDCSGLTSMIYKNVFNKQLVRSSFDIAKSIDAEINKEDLQPGDLVFFATRGRKRINHVGVFLGDRKFIHASVGKGVIVSSLDEAYYLRTWRKGGRMTFDGVE